MNGWPHEADVLLAKHSLENAIANAREYAAEFVHMIQPAEKGVRIHG